MSKISSIAAEKHRMVRFANGAGELYIPLHS